MTNLEFVENNYPLIDGAASAFLGRLYGDNITRDISLAAGVCGLLLLRDSKVDLSEIKPGSVILGAVPDETYDMLQRFIFGWAASQGLNLPDSEQVVIPQEARNYLPEITRFEAILLEICAQLKVKVELFPFVAAAAALKLIAAGEHLRLLASGVGLSLTMYHIIAGSKTVPNDPKKEP